LRTMPGSVLRALIFMITLGRSVNCFV